MCILSMALVTLALSVLPIVIKDLDATTVPLRKVLSYESNIVLMEASIGLGNSFSKDSLCSEQSTLRHVVILANNGLLSKAYAPQNNAAP